MLSFLRALLDGAIFFGVCVGSLLSFLGLFGAWSAYLDFFNHLQLLFLFLALFSFAMTFVWPFYFKSLKKVGRLILMVPIVSSLIILGPDLARRFSDRFLDGQAQASVTSAPLNVMSSNIYLGDWRPARLLAMLKQQNSDIVFLQEVGPKRMRQLKGLSKLYPYRHFCKNWRECSMAILSKYPITDVKLLPLGPVYRWDPLHGKLLAATIQAPGRPPLRVYNVHLSWPEPLRHQTVQRAALKAILKAEAKTYKHQLLAGDFNSSGWSFAMSDLASETGLERHSQFVPTFPSPNALVLHRFRMPAFLSLDHIFASQSLKVAPVVRVKSNVGDHWPIRTQVDFR